MEESIENKGLSKTFEKMTKKQSEEVNIIALELYLKGFSNQKAIDMIKRSCPTDISFKGAQSIWYNVKKEYLASQPFLSNELALKAAVKEIEDLEDKIEDRVIKETPAKYDVLLNSKKHKHELQGLTKNVGNIEINIGSAQDIDFLSSQNANEVVKE